MGSRDLGFVVPINISYLLTHFLSSAQKHKKYKHKKINMACTHCCEQITQRRRPRVCTNKLSSVNSNTQTVAQKPKSPGPPPIIQHRKNGPRHLHVASQFSWTCLLPNLSQSRHQNNHNLWALYTYRALSPTSQTLHTISCCALTLTTKSHGVFSSPSFYR